MNSHTLNPISIPTQQDLVNHILDPIEKRREQARLNRLSKVSDGALSLHIEFGEIFAEAMEIIAKTTLPDGDGYLTLEEAAKFQAHKFDLIDAINRLKIQTTQDVNLGILTSNEAMVIEDATRELTFTGDTKAFENTINKLKPITNSSIWPQIIAAVIGAVIGFFAGLMIGAAAGPAAAITALAGGAVGAIKGAAVGTVGGVLGGIGLVTLFKKPASNPIKDVSTAAEEVFRRGPAHLTLGA